VTRLAHPYLRRWLALSRTRIFVAVVVPCLIGASVALRHGYFFLPQLILILSGLVMVESANLLSADWVTYRKPSFLKGNHLPTIEGSPMIPEKLLPLRYSLHFAISCYVLAALILVYFAVHLGSLIILLGIIAVGIGSFYVLSPIRYGYFSTALLPPIIAFGAYYVLVGSPSSEPIIASLPLMFISSGVIYTYRVLYNNEDSSGFSKNRRMLTIIYASAYVVLIIIVLGGFVQPSMILGLASTPILIAISSASAENSDYLPATSLGVLLYTATGILIILSYILA
jgi:1,4-dihydroxy-2-naphthoate octaprenyltransferase